MTREKTKRIRILTVILTVIAAMLFNMPFIQIIAQDNAHYLVFASDYHGVEGSIESAMSGMPAEVEYVSLIGDMAGHGRDRTPVYASADILAHIQNVFPHLNAETVSLIWADHDKNVVDDPGIVKCLNGEGSGLIYEKTDEAGNPLYYIYGVGFYDMKNGGEQSINAAAAFKAWADSTDKTVPVLVLCHMPLVAKRADNKGAYYWNEALNYAATGTEGIVSAETTGTVMRNVIFLSGHNHTVDENEYFFEAGDTMNVQIDADPPKLEETAELEAGKRPHREPQGQVSNIYYSALTAGYLRTSGNASLIEIGDQEIVLRKYSNGAQVSLGMDPDLLQELPAAVSIPQFQKAYTESYGTVTVRSADENGAELAGSEFTLYDGAGTPLAVYQGGSFQISSEDEVLKSWLSSADTASFILKETKAPEGYEASGEEYEIVVSRTESSALNDHTYEYQTVYGITVAGGDHAEVPHVLIPKQTFRLTVNTDGHGRFVINGTDYTEGSVEFTEGETVTVSVQAEDGYAVSHIELDGSDITGEIKNGSYEITMSKDTVLSAAFAKEAVPVPEEKDAAVPDTSDHNRTGLYLGQLAVSLTTAMAGGILRLHYGK